MHPSRRRTQRLSLILAAIVAWPWPVVLAAIESVTEPGAARPPAPRHSVRPRAMARDDSMADPSIPVAESNDEDGDGPVRTPILFTGPLDARTFGPVTVSDATGSPSPAESPPRLLQSQRLRC